MLKTFIKSEAQRCKEQNTLQDVSNMAVQITIKIKNEGIDCCMSQYPHSSFYTLNAEFPVRFLSRIFLAVLYSFPIKPSLSRKQRKAYLSLSVSVGFDDTLFASLAMSHSLEINCV